MKRTPRVLAAVVAATALTFTGVHTADAKPDRAGTHAKAEKAAKSEKAKSGKGSLSKLDRDKVRVGSQIDKATSEKRLAKLDEADRNAVLANVLADTSALEGVSTRADLRSFRAENYRLAVNVLRKAAKLRAAATEAGVDVSAAMPPEVFAAVAAITAQTPKADAKPALKTARAALANAAEMLDPEGGEAPEGAEVEAPEGSELDEPEDGSTDGVDDDVTDGTEGDGTEGDETVTP